MQILGILLVIGLIYAVMVGLGLTRNFKRHKDAKKAMVINDFEYPNDDLDWTTGGYVKLETSTENQTHGKHSAKATFLLRSMFFPTPTPGMGQLTPAPTSSWRPSLVLDTNSPTRLNVYDWSEYGSFKMDVFNFQDQPITWHAQIVDGRAFRYDDATGILTPKKVTNIEIPLEELINKRLDLTSIRSFSFWVDEAGMTQPPVVFLDYLRLEGEPAPVKKK
jgi:hypothetical protein